MITLAAIRGIGRPEPSIGELLARVEDDRVDFINMQFTDVMGIVKSVTMPVAELEEALTNGVWFDGSAIDGQGFVWNARFAGSCLIRFAPDGRVNRTIELPVTNPTSCCFGGADLKTLYVTSARFGLSAGQIERNPVEGAVLAVRTDSVGTPSVRFAG